MCFVKNNILASNNIMVFNYNKEKFNKLISNKNYKSTILKKENIDYSKSKTCTKQSCSSKLAYKIKSEEYNVYNSEVLIPSDSNINNIKRFNNKLITNELLNSSNSIKVKNSIFDKFKNNNILFNNAYNRYNNSPNCMQNNCDICCLSINTCGNEIQCYFSKLYRKVFKIVTIILILILFFVLVYKCYKADGYPEHIKYDKIKKEVINNLVDNYNIVLKNKKFIDE